MISLIARRVAWSIVVLWAVVTVTFVATTVSPIDPVTVYAGRFATPAVRQQIRQQFGLDSPVVVRYVKYLEALGRGDLGNSISNSEPVTEALKTRLSATAKLALAGIFVEVVIGVPLGIVAAVRPGSVLDRFVLLFSLVGALAPVFVVGFLLLYVLAYKAGMFPLGGYGGVDYLVLPALTVGLAGAPWVARMMRSTLLEIRHHEYVRAARARGASGSRVMWKHMLPNALSPIVTMIGLDAGIFFGGVLVVEQVFAWPGIGQQAWQAVSADDYPMIIGTVLVAAIAVVGFNLVADVINIAMDPRLRRR